MEQSHKDGSEQNLNKGLPAFDFGQVGHIADVNLAELIDYDCPANEVLEWQWIAQNASFTYNHNGQDGVWDFMVNTSIDHSEIPATLAPIIEKARQANIWFILFNQGT
ncbi:hypothetical protein [Shewanella colwelliana]|uniref:hypothetical protein n=1 Tax=Shewanella TaxID=22 RepID=UPI0022B069E6|nr:hypothetical protein [Shewanella colwelliana]MCZ4337625.1 hypothetical protein [Shewanella colwelliana]